MRSCSVDIMGRTFGGAIQDRKTWPRKTAGETNAKASERRVTSKVAVGGRLRGASLQAALI